MCRILIVRFIQLQFVFTVCYFAEWKRLYHFSQLLPVPERHQPPSATFVLQEMEEYGIILQRVIPASVPDIVAKFRRIQIDEVFATGFRPVQKHFIL